MKAYFCEENDILIYATNKKDAVEYATHRLSPEYGYPKGRASNLNLKPVSRYRAEGPDGVAVTWQA